MKKLLTLLMIFTLLLGLAACGSSTGNNVPPEDGNAQTDEPGSAPSQPEDPAEPPQQEENPADADDAQDGGQPEDTSGDSQPVSPEGETDPEDGSQPEDEDDPTKETQTGSQTNDAPAPGSQPEQTPESPADAEPADDPEPAEDPKTIAEGLIGRPVSGLYAAIGEPLSAEYSPSCLDLDTDDGELTYDGFVVYTEGAPDNETVYDVF